MASGLNQGGASAPLNPPLDVLLSAIPSLPRPVLSRLVSRMIDRMDELDPNPDEEACHLEDSFALSWWASAPEGPGCPISDPGGGNVEDEGERSEATL